jgi:membrane protein
MGTMLTRAWVLAKDTVEGFIDDGAMSRGAAIAYYTIFSIAPLLLISTAIAGLVFGQQAVEGAVADQLEGLVGRASAETVQSMVKGAANTTKGTVATVVSVITLLITASGVFGELQTSLNEIWKAPTPEGDTLTRLVVAKAAAIGLVAATGFLLLVSLVVSAALAAVATWVGGLMPGMTQLLSVLNFAVSFLMITLLFGAIYKILPDRQLHFRDVAVGAAVTALLFTIGKTLIGWYIGGTGIATTYGAAGALMVVLVWVFYSSQVFLLGAEFTKAWAGLKGNPEALAAGARRPEDADDPDAPRSRSRRRRRRARRRRQDGETASVVPVVAPAIGAAALGSLLVGLFRRRR